MQRSLGRLQQESQKSQYTLLACSKQPLRSCHCGTRGRNSLLHADSQWQGNTDCGRMARLGGVQKY